VFMGWDSKVAKTVREFNKAMEKYLKLHNFNVIDVYSVTSNKRGFSNKKYHIDGHHLGPKVVPLIELQIN